MNASMIKAMCCCQSGFASVEMEASLLTAYAAATDDFGQRFLLFSHTSRIPLNPVSGFSCGSASYTK